MFAPLLPKGTMTMPELCRWLTAATSVTHTVNGELRDYPVFLSIAAPDPSRVEALVANALGAKWVRDGKTLQLDPVRPKADEGFVEFERQFRLAVPRTKPLASLPLGDLYSMRAGELLRFGNPAGGYFREIPGGIRSTGSETGQGRIYVRRFAWGEFETKGELPSGSFGVYDANSSIEFGSLPGSVTAALGADAKKQAQTAEESTAFRRLVADPTLRKVDYRHFDTIDPLASMVDPYLLPIAKAVKEDLVIAVPDFTMMAMADREAAANVESALGRLSKAVVWRVDGSTIVGALPVNERLNRSQSRRSAVGNFIANSKATGVPTAAALGRYLATQSTAASDCWTDVMMLVMSGIIIDETHLGDYPYNLRLSSALNGADWAILRSGRPHTSTDLSPAAREALLNLLVSSRERMDTHYPDPVTWHDFPSKPLVVSARIVDEEVVIGYVGYAASVSNASSAGANYAMRKRELGREPLYQPAQRRKLILTITEAGTTYPSVETGFAEVTIPAGPKAVVWSELPAALAKEFEIRVEAAKEGRPVGGPSLP